jgi:hypothetical protein
MLIALIGQCEVKIGGLLYILVDLWHHVDEPQKTLETLAGDQ